MPTIVLSPPQYASQKGAIGAAVSSGLQNITQVLFALQQRRDKLNQEAEENRLRQLGISIPLLQMTTTLKRQQVLDERHTQERSEDIAREQQRFQEQFQNQQTLLQQKGALEKGLVEARAAAEAKYRAPDKAPQGTEAERILAELTSGKPIPPERYKLLRQRWKKLNTAADPLALLRAFGAVPPGAGGDTGDETGVGAGGTGQPAGPLNADEYLKQKFPGLQ